MSTVIDTARLKLRPLSEETDLAFVQELLNEPGFLRYIGDKKVRDAESARRYLREGPLASYERHGYGLYHTARKSDGVAVGICGLVRRDALDAPDIGYAILARESGHGYAQEASAAVLAHARSAWGYQRVLGLTTLDNEASIHVLEKLGFKALGIIRIPGHDNDSRLFERVVD